MRRWGRASGWVEFLNATTLPSTQSLNSSSTLAKMIACRPGPTTAVAAVRWYLSASGSAAANRQLGLSGRDVKTALKMAAALDQFGDHPARRQLGLQIELHGEIAHPVLAVTRFAQLLESPPVPWSLLGPYCRR